MHNISFHLRYDSTLKEYLSHGELSGRTSIILLAQLLEGVAHLIAHGVAHRDLKADNLLLDTSEESAPILVISDFGCCLADRLNGLHQPYPSYDIDKGGNIALMAPEIVNQRPGTFSVLNYTKSDLWAVGAIAYEIFGMHNPFYGSRECPELKSGNYKEEDLPELPNTVPLVIRELVRNILSPNPNRVM